jgi:glyoxylase-like metal-dependent hydrolase (beta-lactamase superfamily II)
MIRLKQFVFNPLQVNTWLLHDEGGDGVLIDAAFCTPREQKMLEDYIQEHRINLRYLLNTHGHFDHLFGAAGAKSTFDPLFLIHRDDLPLLETAAVQASFFGFGINGEIPAPDGFLEPGMWLQAGAIRLQVLSVPGHSRGGVALHEPAMRWLFTGDTLFAGGIGRTDLPGGDYDSLIAGIRDQLLILDPATEVFPGHGPTSTIGAEILGNPFLVD